MFSQFKFFQFYDSTVEWCWIQSADSTFLSAASGYLTHCRADWPIVGKCWIFESQLCLSVFPEYFLSVPTENLFSVPSVN